MTATLRALVQSSLLMLFAVASASGAVFDVNSPKDQVDAVIDGACASAEGLCTLRAAVQEAEATVASDVINLPPGKYPLKLTGIFENAAATGDLDITQDLTINGAGIGATIVQGKKDRVFDIFDDAVVAISDLTVTKGLIASKVDSPPEDLDGGGISVLADAILTLTDVAVIGNKANGDGAGIACGNDIVMNRVTIEKNTSRDDGAGFYHFGGTATLTNVTIAKNTSGDEGGGIETQSILACTNCTLSGNKAKNDGGAINVDNPAGDVILTNTTLKGNKSGKDHAGGIETQDLQEALIRNTLLDNKPVNCLGTIALGGGNLESGASCGLPPAESNVKKMGLAGLKDNGGGTKTHALKAESPAVDFGLDMVCPATDQRGVGRVDVPGVGIGVCDSGTYELVPVP